MSAFFKIFEDIKSPISVFQAFFIKDILNLRAFDGRIAKTSFITLAEDVDYCLLDGVRDNFG